MTEPAHTDSETRGGRCRGCSDAFSVTEDQLERMIAVIRRRPEDCVIEPVYEQRLAACRNCTSLIENHTCRHCGCIVQVRALQKGKSCPLPGGSRWTS